MVICVIKRSAFFNILDPFFLHIKSYSPCSYYERLARDLLRLSFYTPCIYLPYTFRSFVIIYYIPYTYCIKYSSYKKPLPIQTMALASLPPDTHQQHWRPSSGSSPTTAKRRYPGHSNNNAFTKHNQAPQRRPHVRVIASTPRRRQYPHASYRPLWAGPDDAEDGLRLAADPNVVLPGDTPRLERQEAFRAPEHHLSDAASDAELYRLGLLYDDDGARGPAFSLDIIAHPEPAYAVRPPRRPRLRRAARSAVGTPVLGRDLSSESLGAAGTAPAARGVDTGEYRAPEEAKRGSQPLTVIYEVVEGSTHSAAEPIARAASEIPDLVSDLEEGEDGCGDDWAILEQEEEETLGADTDAGIRVEAVDAAAAASATGDAWIVLGDGS
ncbi:hypothetical protein F4779DRAFT_599384 [Xylariaceae sp. FL0662B]|nr:hypothetical protein F4779DRAFT_599384 [Xylariaceae sp. FL0662B]